MFRNHWVLWLALTAAVLPGGPAPAGQEEPPQDADAADSEEAAPEKSKTIRFSFDGATLEQVIEFFGRETGLPVVRETDVPQATFTYHSPRAYDMQEALRVLNILLQTRGVMLRVNDDMLYLQKLDDMKREDLPFFQGEVPSDVTSDQVVVTVIPLENALATPIAESFKSMVGTYGSITAMPSQNSVVVVETAGKVRQIRRMISELDREDPEGQIKIFKIRHTKASELMTPLKALLAERVERIIINQQGKQNKVEENEIKGLTISHDDRTNSIIAKGMQTKIDQLAEAIELLDVPSAGQSRMMRSFALLVLSPNEAIQKLNLLYNKLPADERPTILPFEDRGKITVIGAEERVIEAANLLQEIDGGGADDSPQIERTISIIPLQHAEPRPLIDAVRALLNQRQASMTKLVPGSDGKSLILSGLTRDVEMIESLLPALDTPGRIERDVRLVRITTPDPQATLTRARELYEKQVEQEDPSFELTVEYDDASRTATLIGPRTALDRFAESLRMVESNAVVDREQRQFKLENAAPGEIVRPLQTLARQLLESPDGEPYIEPEFTPVDELDTLIIAARPGQFSVIESLVQTLDRQKPGDFQFRVVSLSGVSDVQGLLEKTSFVFDRLTRGYEDGEMPAPEAAFDELTGKLMLTGRSDAIATYERALSEARQLLPPARDGRLIELEYAQAADVVEPLQELLATTRAVDGARQVPPPEIKVVEKTNSLYVLAEEPQHAMIARYVRELDTLEPKDLPPLHLIQVRLADAVQVAQMLRERYESRPQEQRREQPVTIDADAGTNTLIVTAADEVYADIREFVEGLNDSGVDEAERETRLFPLKLARATDLAKAMEKLYPEPPMPLDRRGRPLPHLQEPREVLVSADANTNTLIVEAPSERMPSFEKLVQQLDRVELPPQAELRTYHVERGELNKIVDTLNRIKDQLVHQPGDGSKPVEVMIEAEPESRTLIVAGDETTFQKVEQMLADLSAVPVERELRVIEVVRAEPQELADRALSTYQNVTKDDPNATEVEVEVDPENGTLMVVAEPEAMVRFVGIVNQIQESIGPPADVRLLELEYAKPSDVVEFLTSLAEDEISRFGNPGAPMPTFYPMDRLNGILVSARPGQHPIIESLVQSLDQQESQEMPPLRILQLRTADAQNFANALMRQYDQRPADEKRLKPVNITADPNTNALIIAAHPDVLPEIEAIVQDLNDVNRMDGEGREIRIFPLKVARAEELAKTIDEMYPEPEPLYDRRGRPIPGTKEPREVVVRADAQTNSLIVDATVQRMAGFEQLVEQLDRQQLDADTEVRTYEIVHADLQSLASTIQNLIRSGSFPGVNDRRSATSVTTEPVSQSLIVSGPPEIFPKLEEVLTTLDAKPSGPSTSLKFFQLEHARADSLAPMLREILVARMDEELPEARRSSTDALLNVSSDRKTNMLIISAPDALMPLAEQIVKQLDTPSAAVGDPVVRVRPLTFANAADVTNSLRQALPDLMSEKTGDPVDVQLIPTSSSNAIILVGPETDMPQVESLIEGLDQQQQVDALAAETLQLEHATASTIAPVLERLLTNQMATDPRIIAQQIRRSRGQLDFTPEIQVEADDRTNTVIVSGTKQTVELARTLVQKLDEPDEMAGRTFETFTPANAEVSSLIATVKQVIDSTRPTGRRSTLELIAEPNSGAIVVIGQEDETTQALSLLEKWDASALSPPQIDLKIVPLEHSEATVVANAITPMLRDQSRWPKSLRTLLERGVAVSQPTVTADAAANRLLISAPKELLPMASELIAQLDVTRGEQNAADLRIFNLEQAQASDVAGAVQDAMTSRARSRPGEPAPSVTAEPSSNSLIVSATPAQLQEIESIVNSLDTGVVRDQAQVRTVFLKHARAENLAPIVEQLLTAEEEIDMSVLPNWLRGQIIAQQRQEEGPPGIRVAADARLNAVVISATAPVLDIAEQMVMQLDVDPSDIPGSTRRLVRVLTIDNADASELAQSLGEVFAEETQTGEPAPTIRVNQASNSLIVRATEQQFTTIESIAGEIDRAALGTTREMMQIPIDPARASAREVAETLRRMLDRRGGSRVEVITLDELLKRRAGEASSDAGSDEPKGGDDSVSMAPNRPFDLIVASMFAASGQDADHAADALREQIEAGADVTIAVDEATNTLIVVGSSRAVDRVRSLAEQVQAQIPALPGTIRYVGLPETVDARVAAQLVNQTLGQMTPAGGNRGELRRRVSVLPDPTNNALIIAANDVDFETVADLLVAITQPPSTEAVVVKVYPLEKITANRAADSVRQLIGEETDPRARRGRQSAEMRRNLEIELRADGRTIDAVFDPSQIRISSDEHSNSLIVMGPEEAISFIDQYVSYIDQSSPTMEASLKIIPLKHAQATDLNRTIRDILRARYNALPPEVKRTTIQPEVAIDSRSNTLIITASPEQLTEAESVLERLDVEFTDTKYALRIIELEHLPPSDAQQVIDQVVIGNDQEMRKTTSVVPIDEVGRLLVRAPEEINQQIDEVLAEIDRDVAGGFEVRTIVLERANASSVAQTLQQLYEQRAEMAGRGRGRRSQRNVAIIGDEMSRTLVVAASDEDFAVIQDLVEQFDSADATGKLEFKIYELRHARAFEIQQTVQQLINDLTWGQGPIIWGPRGPMLPGGGAQGSQGTVAVRANERLNALIVTGEGDRFEIADHVIATLDAPKPEGAERVVRVYPVANVELGVMSDVVRQTMTESTRARRPWEPRDPNEIVITPIEKRKALIVAASASEHEEIESLIEQLDSSVETAEQAITVLDVENAAPSEVARTLSEFMRAHAESMNQPAPTAAIIPSDNANSLVVSANDTDLAMIRDLLARLDEPISDNRVIEIVKLRKGDAEDVARIINEQFGARGGQGVRVTPDVRTNSLIINAPKQSYEPAKEMIALLDSPPPSDEMIIRTYPLEGAQASEVVRLLTDTLELDAEGETSGISVNLEELEGEPVVAEGKVIADRRSNSIVIRATPESLPVFETLIQRFDEADVKVPVEWRIIKLDHALAYDVSFTLRQFLRNLGDTEAPDPRIDYNEPENQLFISATPDQFKQIEELLEQIDTPKERPVTKFVKLEYASAESVRDALGFFYGPFAPNAKTPPQLNARIVANPATNSLLISAEESEWENIERYIAQFDSEEYDPTLQLRILALQYADAQSVAQAINDAFQAQLQGGRGGQGGRGQSRGQQQVSSGGNDDERRDQQAPTVLVESEEWVRAAAEPITNTVLVSANRQNMKKIETIVGELDIAEYAQGPAPRLIAVRISNPQQLAESLNQVYQQARAGRGGGGRKAVTIVANEASSTLIVRAPDDEFEQIQTLADALQQEAETKGLNVHVLQLASAPASRVEAAIRDAFQAKAQQTGQPLSIKSDPSGNSLIVACTAGLFAEIERTVEQLDSLQPAAGQGIFIIELENIDPESAKSIIETIGLHQPQDPDSVSRLVTEPIKVSTLDGRNAIIVIGNPADRDTIVSIVNAIDAEPDFAETEMRVVQLRNAEASAVSQIISEMLQPENQQSSNKLAQAVTEQIRRLSVRRNGVNGGDIALDLSKPIRVIVNDASNALIVGSTPGNVEALIDLIGTLDQLPITDAVVVQLFPLENIQAEEFRRIVQDLFNQGKNLGTRPLTNVQGVPPTESGRALMGEIAMTTDERTNTVVVAGPEEAVAFVEVMKMRLDSQVAVGWVEPRIMMLKHADATELSETINAILVEGNDNLPQSTPIQDQIGRIRVAKGQAVQSDVFTPMTRLVVRPHEQLNALVVVGTKSNLDVISELVSMFDIEEASPDSTVRIYPVKHASAARLANTVTQLFDQQVDSKAIRPEDRVIVQADERTNALIVTTSPRSFAVLESLLKTLDAEVAPDLREIRRIEIKNASATRLAEMIQELMDARMERLQTIEPETAELEKVAIVADERTNSLVVAAGNDSFEVVKGLAKELDTATELAGSGVQVIPLTRSNGERIAENVRLIMERRYAEMPAEVRAIQEPLILTDPRSNSLLVAANPADFNSIKALVEQLESTPLNPAVGITVLPLERKQAEDLAPRIEQMMQDRIETLGNARTEQDRVSIEPDPASNSLIVAASEENLEIIRGLIDALIEAESRPEPGEFDVITLARSRAEDMIETIEELYVSEENRKRGDNAVRVTADTRLNALLVKASQEDIDAIRNLVERIEGGRRGVVMEIQTIPLEAADPLEIVSLIEEVLRGPGLAGRRNAQQATIFRLISRAAAEDGVVREGETDDVEISTAIRESISLVPDRRTNSVIVSAPKESMEMIQKFITDLDSSKTGSQNLRVFPLENADAEAMAQILTDLFRTPTRDVLRPRDDAPTAGDVGEAGAAVEGAAAGAQPFGLTELTTVPDERQQLSITVDTRTNSLLVSGTPRYLDLVEQVVHELDTKEANEREQFVYPLKNAVAADVARVVGDFVEEDQQKLVETLGADQIGSANRLLEREVTIVGDEKSNTVLVSASPRYMGQVKDMIAQLDVDPPQVLIQVLLAEITLDSGDEWGVDFAGTTTEGDVDISAGFGLASAFLSGAGVPNLAIAGTDFDLLIRALRSQGRLQVLSNPSIMAANNEVAEIQIGETIRVPVATQVTDAGLQSSVEEEELGVILNVTPTINPEGFVRMVINPEISNLSTRTTQISETFESPIITVRRANTTVTVMDGQTVVLGGLISDRFEIREEAVPLLSDLPILGALFRSRSEQRQKTELLIVLTPHVVKSPAELAGPAVPNTPRSLTEEEIQRLSVPKSIEDQIRRGRIEETELLDFRGNPLDDRQEEHEPDQSDSSARQEDEEEPDYP